jgi:small subunit ribosomal protein S20
LANIKSAKKRILVTETKAVAATELKNATSVIEAASTKGVYHKNNAARKVSRLAKLVNGIA